MRHLTDKQAEVLRQAVGIATGLEALPRAVAAIYRDFQTELDARKPACDQSGRCCRFDEYGHLLFVTTAELAVFMRNLSSASPQSEPPSKSPHRLQLFETALASEAVIAGGVRQLAACPYQLNNLCSVHTLRPFGCRVFFCDPTATAWQQQQYDRFHSRIRDLHDELAIPYMYVEWRQGLMALQLQP